MDNSLNYHRKCGVNFVGRLIEEKYLGYSVRDTKIDLSETPTDKLKKDLKKVYSDISKLEQEQEVTKGSAPIYTIKEQISNLELMASRIEKELSEREDTKMEYTDLMLESIRDFLQEQVDDGEMTVEEANDLLDFACEDYNEEDYSSNVTRLEDVVETCINKLGITDLSVFEEMEGIEVIDYLIDQTEIAYESEQLSEYEATLMFEYLNVDNYDENAIFIESVVSDAEDSLDREQSETRKEAAMVGVDNDKRPTFKKIVKQVDAGGKKIDAETRSESPEQFKEKIIGDTPHKPFEKLVAGKTDIPSNWVQGRRVIKAQTVSEKADDNHWAKAGEQLKDGVERGAAGVKVLTNTASDKLSDAAAKAVIKADTAVGIAKAKAKNASAKINKVVNDTKIKAIDASGSKKKDFGKEVDKEVKRRKIKKAVRTTKKELQEKVDKLEAEVERLKAKLSKEEDKNEKKKITAKIADVFKQIKEKKNQMKDAE